MRQLVLDHALGAAQLLTAWLVEQAEAVAAVRVAARQHAGDAALLVPLVETDITLHWISLSFLIYSKSNRFRLLYLSLFFLNLITINVALLSK